MLTPRSRLHISITANLDDSLNPVFGPAVTRTPRQAVEALDAYCADNPGCDVFTRVTHRGERLTSSHVRQVELERRAYAENR